MRRRRRPYYQPNHDRWLISYADYVTLLLALFVVLYAMSSVDVDRLQTMVSGMRTAFVETGSEAGGSDRALPEPGGSPSDEATGADPDADDLPYVVLRDRVEATLEDARGSDQGENGMQTHRSDRGLVISLAAEEFFESGDTRILSDALGPLNAIGSVLALSTLPIRVEGHTDDRP
ncbi:MAG: flagellar motor protein MotB, partial [Myxococcota bacterium]|nr:flagellar motor protein MotB [Myxococcota bacterium]